MINDQIGFMADMLIDSLGEKAGAVFYSKDDWKAGREGQPFEVVFLESFKDVDSGLEGEAAPGFTGPRPVMWYKTGEIIKPKREDVIVKDKRAFRVHEIREINAGMIRLDLQEL